MGARSVRVGVSVRPLHQPPIGIKSMERVPSTGVVYERDDELVAVGPVTGCGKGGRGPAFHNLTGLRGPCTKRATA